MTLSNKFRNLYNAIPNQWTQLGAGIHFYLRPQTSTSLKNMGSQVIRIQFLR